MKRYNNFIVILVLLIFTLNGCCKNDIINNKDNSLELETLNYQEIKDKLIRFHVIANSDTEEDQSLKLKVRDKDVILNNNYDYEVNTMLSYENFPDKVYGDYVFPQGNYEAFRVIIGSGQGRNWWCVMFPSLCFVDESKSDVNSDNLKQEIENIKPKEINNLNNENDDIKFKSKMVDVVKNLFK